MCVHKCVCTCACPNTHTHPKKARSCEQCTLWTCCYKHLWCWLTSDIEAGNWTQDHWKSRKCFDSQAISPAPVILSFSLYASSFLNSKGKPETMDLTPYTLYIIERFLKITLPQKIQTWFCIFDLEMSFRHLNLAFWKWYFCFLILNLENTSPLDICSRNVGIKS